MRKALSLLAFAAAVLLAVMVVVLPVSAEDTTPTPAACSRWEYDASMRLVCMDATATIVPTQTRTASATRVPPTATQVPPTATKPAPTNTAVIVLPIMTATPVPTIILVPPTATQVTPTVTNVPPTATLIPPTATQPVGSNMVLVATATPPSEPKPASIRKFDFRGAMDWVIGTSFKLSFILFVIVIVAVPLVRILRDDYEGGFFASWYRHLLSYPKLAAVIGIWTLVGFLADQYLREFLFILFPIILVGFTYLEYLTEEGPSDLQGYFRALGGWINGHRRAAGVLSLFVVASIATYIYIGFPQALWAVVWKPSLVVISSAMAIASLQLPAIAVAHLAAKRLRFPNQVPGWWTREGLLFWRDEWTTFIHAHCQLVTASLVILGIALTRLFLLQLIVWLLKTILVLAARLIWGGFWVLLCLYAFVVAIGCLINLYDELYRRKRLPFGWERYQNGVVEIRNYLGRWFCGLLSVDQIVDADHWNFIDPHTLIANALQGVPSNEGIEVKIREMVASKKCSYCGAPVGPTDEYCKRCGESQTNGRFVWVCQSCGQPHHQQREDCVKCVGKRPRSEDQWTKQLEALGGEVARLRTLIEVQQALSGPNYCPRCNVLNRRGSRYCNNCGQALAQ